MRDLATPIIACMVLALGWLSPASAQPPATDDRHVFEAAHFVAGAPRNAYDMLLQVPAFTIIESDADVRGYAAALGNVLIDGAHPASKREDIASVLKRIPARSVERIELIRTATRGIEMAGHALVANIVRIAEATSETAIDAGLVASTDGWFAPQAAFEYGRRRDDRGFDLAIKVEPEFDDDSGRGTVRTRAADGSLIDASRLDTRSINRADEATASWRQPLADGRLSLTAALRGERADVDSTFTPDDESESSEDIREHERLREAEAGVRYVRSFAARTTLEVVASQRLGWLDANERAREGDDSEAFDERTETGERLGRIDLTHEWSDRLTLSSGLEGAFNSLDSRARLFENDEAVLLPGSDVRIEENRSEGSIGATWKPGGDWIVESALRIEQSTIEQSGDSPLQRRFRYSKPRLAVRWDGEGANQWRLGLTRDVGQLDFADFVASASLDTGVISAGNAELEPDKTWRLEAAWQRQLWTDAAFTLTVAHDRISDVVDRVLVVTPDDVFDAPGNIGDGRRNSVAFDVSAPLDRFGIAGARLRSTVLWQHSRVTDPVTGEPRGISEEKPVEASIEFRQALPSLRMDWGIVVDEIAARETQYRFDEITRESERASWTLFAERKLAEQWRLRVQVTDLFGRSFREQQGSYDGTRADGALEDIERRDRRTPGVVSIRVRRSFGG